MTPLFPPIRHAWTAWLLACAVALPAQAERADRAQPLNVAADRQGIFDLANQVVVFSGDVIITKGTIVIKADRVEVRESPDGYRTAVAISSKDRPATFRQKRDNVEEYIEGRADRLEYNEKTDTVRFLGDAKVYRLRGATIGDEITGNLITYDNASEVFSVTGKPPATAGAPGGRVRAVLTPREGTPAAEEAASQAAPSLRSSPSLGDKR